MEPILRKPAIFSLEVQCEVPCCPSVLFPIWPGAPPLASATGFRHVSLLPYVTNCAPMMIARTHMPACLLASHTKFTGSVLLFLEIRAPCRQRRSTRTILACFWGVLLSGKWTDNRVDCSSALQLQLL